MASDVFWAAGFLGTALIAATGLILTTIGQAILAARDQRRLKRRTEIARDLDRWRKRHGVSRLTDDA